MTKWLFVIGLLLVAPATWAQTAEPEPVAIELPPLICDPLIAAHEPPLPPPEPDPLLERLFKYTQLAVKHRLRGLASYYSGFFDGRKTANGEIFRNGRYSAAHLTLPLGSWVEITSRATGRKLRLRVNDRGPYVNKFAIDLSQAAARYLGVDRARDRYVEVRIIALPGEEPLPEDVDWTLVEKLGGGELTATAAR